MEENAFKPVMLGVRSDNAEVLESLVAVGSQDIRTGKVHETAHVRDAKLDPLAVAETTLQVIGVINTIGGAARFIDWVIEKINTLRRPNATSSNVLRIEIGTVKLEITSSSDPVEVRKLISELLQLGAR